MRSIASKLAAVVFALALVAAVPSAAQAQWFVAVSPGVSGFSGDDWDNDSGKVKAGFAAQAAVGSRVGSAFSIAGVFGWSTHSTDGVANLPEPSPSDDKVNAISIQLQPAVRIGGADGGASGFIGARGGYASVGIDEKATGLTIGPVAGAAIPLSDRTSVGVAGSYNWLNLSNDNLSENLKGGQWGAGVYLLVALGGS